MSSVTQKVTVKVTDCRGHSVEQVVEVPAGTTAKDAAKAAGIYESGHECKITSSVDVVNHDQAADQARQRKQQATATADATEAAAKAKEIKPAVNDDADGM